MGPAFEVIEFLLFGVSADRKSQVSYSTLFAIITVGQNDLPVLATKRWNMNLFLDV
jgi:hypothetical protein